MIDIRPGPARRRTPWSVRAAAGLAAVSLSLTACSAGAPGATGTSAPISDASVQTLVGYTGGRAGGTSGDPIDIGFINAEGGAISYPEFSVELHSLVELINGRLGGAGGRPLKVVSCLVSTGESQGQSCAQQFLADRNMALVIQGPLEVGQTSFHSTLDGRIPVIGALPNAIDDATAKNAFYLGGGVLGSLGFVTYATQYAHAKKVSLLVPAGVPAGQESAARLKAAFEARGVTVSQGTYANTATDYLAAIEASGARDADVFIPLVITPNQCLALGRSLQQVPTRATVLSFDACLGSSVKEGLQDFPKWTYLSPTSNAAAPSADPTTQAYVKAYDEWFSAIASQIPDQNTGVVSMMTTLTAVKMLQAAGADPAPGAVTAELRAFTGPLFLGAPELAFGRPPFTAVGTTASSFTSYLGEGRWQSATDGRFVAPPAMGPPAGGPPPGAPPPGAPPSGN